MIQTTKILQKSIYEDKLEEELTSEEYRKTFKTIIEVGYYITVFLTLLALSDLIWGNKITAWGVLAGFLAYSRLYYKMKKKERKEQINKTNI